MDIDKLKAILAALKGSEVSRLDWSDGEERLELRFGHPPATHSVQHTHTGHAASVAGPPTAAPSAASALHPAPPAPPPAPPGKIDAKTFIVSSPFVGTFYRSASPEVPAFVEVGAAVRKGQVLCIVEAMKLMNEIESEQAGTIVEVLVQNGSPVEYGEPLFRLEPA